MAPISYSDYLDLARNPETTDAELLEYVRIVPGRGGFSFTIEPDPEKVVMTDADAEFESVLGIGNGIDRFRRTNRFFHRLNDPGRTVLVSEGDSWFQFPLVIRETIDALGDHHPYNIWSVGAAGDTLENMVYGASSRGKREYMIALRRQRSRVRAFLFSGAGNDIIGEDEATGRPVLVDLLAPFNGDTTDVLGHINTEVLRERLDDIEDAYRQVIADIRGEPGLRDLPVLIHGYDYPFPFPAQPGDGRNPIYAKSDQWLGSAFAERGIEDAGLRRGIVTVLIDQLYTLLAEIAGDPAETGVWLVDCRGTLPDLSDWADEIHATDAGFEKVAARFAAVLDRALA